MRRDPMIRAAVYALWAALTALALYLVASPGPPGG
jgi:hypothetical protein